MAQQLSNAIQSTL